MPAISSRGDATKPSRRISEKPAESGGGMLPWRPSGVMATNLTAGSLARAPEGPGIDPTGDRLRLSRVGAVRANAPTFADDVRRGLTASPKVLYPKYFYDELGSRLFEAITALPEYYPTK